MGLHAKLTQIEGIVKAHLAKVNFDREALDMDVRYISKLNKKRPDKTVLLILDAFLFLGFYQRRFH